MIALPDITAAVATHFRLAPEALVAKDRHKTVAFARHVAMWLARQLPVPPSYPEIGRAFGNRDHTTVMHAVASIEGRRADVAVRAHLESILDALKMVSAPPGGEMAVWEEGPAPWELALAERTGCAP